VIQVRGEGRILRTRGDLLRHVRQWEEAADWSTLPFGMIVAAEGADGILSPEQLHEWHAGGMRVVSLAHSGITHYAHGYQHTRGTSGGLFPKGRRLLKEMDALGMVLDVSHASEDSMRESLEIFTGPVLASHHNCRALVPGPRQISDEQIKMIVARGAVIGHLMSANQL
jgi:membrane dipeptidase